MYEAKRIMTRAPFTVHENTPIYEAMNLLVKKKISGLPVVDQNQKLVGVITEKDIVHLLMEKDIKETHLVSHFMTRDVVSFSMETSAVELAEFFSQNTFRRVPIVDDDGILVGVVARRDIIVLILDIRGALDKT